MSNDLEETLLEHLQALAKRGSCRINDLPEGFTVDVVCVLDARGWIKTRRWVHPSSLFKSGEEPIPEGNNWFTGVTEFDIAGAWDGVFTKARERPDLAWEIRVSGKGKAKLAERRVAGTKPEKKPGESKQTRDIDEVRIYELVKDDRKTYEQAGIAHAREQGRDKPYSPEAVHKACKRHEATLADMGLKPDGRSISRRNTHRLRDDDGATT